MKISELTQLEILDLDLSIPVVASGQTMRITMRQIADVLSSDIALFGEFIDDEVVELNGTTEAAGDVVYVASVRRFMYRVIADGAQSYYSSWSGRDRYMDGDTPLSSVLFIDISTRLMYRYDPDVGLGAVGLSAEQSRQLALNTPIAVESEDAMEQMIASGQCAEGQLYYVAEE